MFKHKKVEYAKDWLQFTKYLMNSAVTETKTLSNGRSKMKTHKDLKIYKNMPRTKT
jgi:hypothetical protein